MIEYNEKLYVAAASGGVCGLYVSSDGTTFTQVSDFPSTMSVYALMVYNNKLYIGTASGLYITEDGTNFVLANSSDVFAVEDLTAFNNKIYAIMYDGRAGNGGRNMIFQYSEDGAFKSQWSFNGRIYSLTTYKNKVWINGSGYIGTIDSSGVLNQISKSYGYRGFGQYKGLLYIGASNKLFSIAVSPSSSNNLTVDLNPDSIIGAKVVADGNEVMPLFAKKLINQVELTVSSDATTGCFPATNVYAVVEYTKP
jgi:ligand-binding sensor domain-containing protein